MFPLILNAQYQREQSISKATILKNINIIDVENSYIVEGVDIVIQGGIIKTIGHSISSSAEDKKELDMTGKDADIMILNGNPIDNIANLKQIEHVIKKKSLYNDN